MLNIAPMPRVIKEFSGCYCLKTTGHISIDERGLFDCVYVAKKTNLSMMQIVIGEYSKNTQIRLLKNSDLAEEGYRLTIDKTGVVIAYSTYAGAFYGMMTLNQIINERGLQLPFLCVEDEPDFRLRGYMLDISRNKIPKLDTLYQMVDFLASVKINHLQLYFEGAPFPYPSFPDMWTKASVLTGEEIVLFDKYCKDRFIDLVPTQNTFGHMGSWLNQGKYAALAECPDGFINPIDNKFWPDPLCLNPLDEKSIQHVTTMSDEILAYFSSDYYNVCCDETFELGLGKSKEYADRVGKGKIYLEFLMKLYDYCKNQGKCMLFWADIINHYPELIPELPKDLIALNWGYFDDLPTEASCVLFEENKIPYCVCPGTAVWNTQLGNTAQMLDNIKRTIQKGWKHSALGVITTDWGDGGHTQGEAPHFAGILYGASMSWCVEKNEDMDLAATLNEQVFFDQNGKMGEFVLKIGDYATAEYKKLENITLSFKILRSDIMDLRICDDATHDQLDKMAEYVNTHGELLYQTNMHCKDAELYIREYEVGMQMIKLAAKMGHFHLYKKENNTDALLALASEIATEMGWIITELKDTWLVKNKPTKINRSVRVLVKNLESLSDFLRKNL